MAGEPFKTDRLVLCEGVEDAAFLRAFIAQRALGAYDVRANIDAGGVGGNSGFGRALVGSVTVRNFRQISRIALVADSDTHWQNALAQVNAQITWANTHPDVAGKFHVPNAPYQLSGGHPRVMIALLPALNTLGALETLLWNSVANKPNHAVAVRCIEDACQRCGIGNWSIAKQFKAKIHMFLALRNETNPSVGLGKLWTQAQTPIPLNDAAFDALEQVLRNL